MIIHKNHVLIGTNKKPIVYDVYYKKIQEPQPVIVYSHGYKGFKDWGAWPLVAEYFADAGFCFLKFNFSHNGGTVGHPIDFPDLEAFGQNNFSIELDDLDRVLTHIKSGNNDFPKQISTISLMGHSRGGGIVLIKAKEDSRVDSVICLASVSNFESRFFKGTPEFGAWKKNGIIHIENARTEQKLPHYFQFYEDFDTNRERFSIKQTVQDLKKPLLILHGDADPAVKIEEAEALHSWKPDSVLEIIPGADHVFGSSHPWKERELPKDLKIAVEKTIDFLK